MTDLTRLLEYLATAEKGQLDIVKYSRTSWLVRLNDLDDVHATGVGGSLEAAARCCLSSALSRGLLDEPCPRTEPPGWIDPESRARMKRPDQEPR